MVDASQFPERAAGDFPGAVREYFRETLAMVESGQAFETLAHIDYPKRYWLDGAKPYREADYEAEIRAVLKAAAATGRVLEVNTTRGRALTPHVPVARWSRGPRGQAVQSGTAPPHPPNLT